MTLVVTGADGFLGWHLRCRLQAAADDQVVPLTREELMHGTLPDDVGELSGVFHLAGVNRGSAVDVERGNVEAAEQLLALLDAAGQRPRIVFANSVQAGADSPYGRGKAIAARLLSDWAQRRGTSFVDLVLPNLFGEHGRPDYNSFVATFCDRLADGQSTEVRQDRDVPLLHAQEAAQHLVAALDGPDGQRPVPAVERRISDVAGLLGTIAGTYASGEIPPLADPFELQLFNTYRSFLADRRPEIALAPRADERGTLVECVRMRGGAGQTFLSTTHPGHVRGQHFHLAKVERFIVVQGRGTIVLRRLFHDKVVRLPVSGDRPVAVDMPTMWAHALVNDSAEDLTAAFWTNELFDPLAPDTWAEQVQAS